MVQLEKLTYNLRTREGNAILIGLDTLLKLNGSKELSDRLRQILDITGNGKTIILTLSTSKWLNYRDPRLGSSGKISIIDGESSALKKLCFLRPGIADPDIFIDGINELTRLTKISTENIIVLTNHSSVEFPNSLYSIKDFENAYQILIAEIPEISALDYSYGTDEQWTSLYQLIDKYGSLENTLLEWGGRNGLKQSFARFDEFDSFQKWLYLLAVKLYGAGSNTYLSKAARKSKNIAEFVSHICNDILDIDIKNVKFNEIYSVRKDLIKHLNQYPDCIDKYCKLCLGKGFEGMQYLTDSSKREKETIIALLSSYGKELGRTKAMEILKIIYPALSIYLQDYSYGNELLNRYFRIYKFDKATNSISAEMREMVDGQSIVRDYNSILQPVSLITDHLERKDSVLYFIDALGAEYLSYLQYNLFEHGFDAKIQLARCELPSITEYNKDFVEVFKNDDCTIISKKELDNIKHNGEESYDYQHTKLPIHLVRELEILDELCAHLKGSLEKGKTAFIISDHGSSRLAVINEKENKWEVSEKGIHSGRCCPKSDISEKPDYATESNEHWCLANYDRFKGGRKAMVEVHGGATFEEITIPIIEVTKRDKTFACIVRNNGPALRSAKTAPVLKLFVEKDTANVSILLDGITYKSRGCTMPYVHDIELSGIKRSGNYNFDVYCDEILTARDLEIEVASQGAREKSFF